jgi:hypothetical protein
MKCDKEEKVNKYVEDAKIGRIESEPAEEVCNSPIRKVYLDMSKINGIENIKEYCDITQVLDKLSTPVVVTFFSREDLYTDWYVCPECNNDNIQKKDKFCGGCGKPIKVKE